jgi:cyclopropane-fatty-acyl-phospholipid synthase
MKPTIALHAESFSRSRHPGQLNRWAAQLLHRQLAQLKCGEIVLADGEVTRFGRMTDEFPVSVRIDVVQPSFYGNTVFGGSLGAAEGYMAGAWRCTDLVGLVRIMVRNRHVLEDLDGGLSRVAAPVRKILHAWNRNTEEGSQRNIAAHYDLGNDFFKLFLDETLMYSCALFERPEMSLKEASIAKLDRICRLLELKPDDRVIEIGTGWGGFALHAATRYGCHVTTTTISENQYQLAADRIREAGMEDRITLLKQDYRKLVGQYDKLVSIEMIEAVGHHYFQTFFRKCAELLKPDGLMLLQAITINDREYRRARDEVDFIKRYIFPGSCIPAITALLGAATRASDLQLIHLDDIGPHYATTLRCWREAFLSQLDAVRAQGYPEPFIRLWEFYLAYCEGGYAERALGDVHLLMAKPLYRG